MPLVPTHSPYKRGQLQLFSPPLISFSLIIFFVSVGDAIMSYLSPVYLAHHLSPWVMGLVISFSSLVGFICDLFFPRLFFNKSYSFFSWLTIFSALAFPISLLLLPPVVSAFLLAMAVWGIYYELLHFSQFHFINRFLSPNQFTTGWGVIAAFKAAAYLVGPIIAVFILASGFALSFASAFLFFTAAALGLLLFTRSPSLHRSAPASPHLVRPTSRHALRIWRLLWVKVWPLYLFLFSISVIDSTFWTIGTLLSEQLRQTSFLGGFLLPAYSLPALFMGLLARPAAAPAGKKRAAFVAALLAGLLLLPIGFISSPPLLIATVFTASLFLALSFPEIYATFEDYVRRLGHHGDEMIGLQSTATSLAYIIGPILAGFISTRLGHQFTFTLIGAGSVLISLITLTIVPRKIHLPQSQIESV